MLSRVPSPGLGARVLVAGGANCSIRSPATTASRLDLIDTLARETVRPAPLEVDPYYNLFVYLRDVVRLCRTTDFGDLVPGVVGASARDENLARCFRAFWERRRRLAAPLVVDITGHDLDEERLAVLLDRLFAPLYYRLLLTGADLTDAYLWDLVTDNFTPHPGADLAGAWTRHGDTNDHM